jgi:electron transfer flavoprotein alpha subunit
MNDQRIMIYAQADSKDCIESSYFELLSKAKNIFNRGSEKFAAVLMGSHLEDAKKLLAVSGVDIVYAIDDSRLETFNPEFYIPAMEEAVHEFGPDVLLIGATPIGEEIAPALGQRLKTGVAAHCVDLTVNEEGQFIQMVPAFGGKVIGEIFIPNARPQIASVKPGIFQRESLDAGGCEVVDIPTDVLDRIQPRINVLSRAEADHNRCSVEKADVVVCGGFGVGSEACWCELEKLAEKLNGAVGCTRPALDANWMKESADMIGTSGKTIRPKLYFGIGVSGSAHHICGIQNTDTIISVNNDPDADIFKYSDYKIVMDSATILSELLRLV